MKKHTCSTAYLPCYGSPRGASENRGSWLAYSCPSSHWLALLSDDDEPGCSTGQLEEYSSLWFLVLFIEMYATSTILLSSLGCRISKLLQSSRWLCSSAFTIADLVVLWYCRSFLLPNSFLHSLWCLAIIGQGASSTRDIMAYYYRILWHVMARRHRVRRKGLGNITIYGTTRQPTLW